MAKKMAKITISEVESAAKEFAQANFELQAITAERGKELLVVEEKYKEKIDAETQRIKDAEDLITTYLKDNPDVFDGKKSRKVWGVTIAHRSGDKWNFPDGGKWEDFKGKIKEILPEYIKSVESVDIESVRASYDDVKEKLSTLGISLEEDTKYSIRN